jgi:FkbH-like protein
MNSALVNPVKLVVWDLDETLWRGTLAEEGMTPVPRNVEIVRELSRRGIINSICSKNDFERAKAKVTELGIWDQFVFPSITFNPKGKAVADIIETAALRAENVLFIDDNPSNREEVKFFNPGIMTGDPADLLETLLDHAHLKGKADPELTRLKQYRLLERKAEDKRQSTTSNEEFLRSCNIRVMIDHDVDKSFDRVVELINRTNQLNYTKVRLNTPEEIAAFREQLNAFSYHAGCVRVADEYGDYGLVGFFLLQRRAGINALRHFVFSCRTMNMGVEQYVYEMLGSPDIDIADPVSYGIKSHDTVDWITAGNPALNASGSGAETGKLILVGGCDLLQLASYCSTDRLEFVNRVQDTGKARFEDPGFFMGDREAIKNCATLRALPSWTYEDTQAFDEGIASANLVLLSLWPSMNADYYLLEGKVRVRLLEKQINRLGAQRRKMFQKNSEKLSIPEETRHQLLRESFDTVAKKSPDHAQIFVLGTYTQAGLNNSQNERRNRFNEMCRAYCAAHPGKFRYVDINALLPPEKLVDNVHFSREGYLMLARHILDRAKAGGDQAPVEPARKAALSA